MAPSGESPPEDGVAVARFEALAAEAPSCIAVERSTLGLPTTWGGAPAEAAELSAADFDRSLDWRWRRTSYSDITAGTYEARVASEPEETTVTDEPVQRGDVPATTGSTDEPTIDKPSLLADMPVGLQVGTLVHRVLEGTDFAATDLDAELGAQIAVAQARRQVELGDTAAVVAGLRAAIETPLGSVLDNGAA